MRLCLCLSILVLAIAVAMQQLDAAERPNVVFIAIDDLKPLIGAYGDPYAKTPNIDRLAAMGVRFQRAYCQQAVCGPSRASLLCGVHPDTLGIYDLKTKIRTQLPDIVTLPQHFRQQGYTSIGFGKIFDPRNADAGHDSLAWSQPHLHSHQLPKVEGMPRGRFGYFEPGLVAKMDAELATLRAAGKKGYWQESRGLLKAGLWMPTDRADVPEEAYSDCLAALHAQRELTRLKQAGEPFFLAVGFARPHLPFNAPEKYWAMYDDVDFPLAEPQERPEGAPKYAWQDSWELRGGYSGTAKGPIAAAQQKQLIHGYYAAASFVDAQVGRVLDTLDELGIADETIIVLWGDHGWHLGDHGMFGKHTNYEQAAWSPLIIAAPSLAAGAVVEQPVEFVDIYPTLCAQAGLDAPAQLEGQDLTPLVGAETDATAVAVSQFPRQTPEGVKVMGYSFRDLRYRYIRWVTRDDERRVVDEELYDYQADPLEGRNLIDDAELATVRTRLASSAVDFLKTSIPLDIK